MSNTKKENENVLEDYTECEMEKIMIEYLILKVVQKDWHGVSDAANDLREMDARKGRKI